MDLYIHLWIIIADSADAVENEEDLYAMNLTAAIMCEGHGSQADSDGNRSDDPFAAAPLEPLVDLLS